MRTINLSILLFIVWTSLIASCSAGSGKEIQSNDSLLQTSIDTRNDLKNESVVNTQDTMLEKITIETNKKTLQAYIEGHPNSKKSKEPINTYYTSKDVSIIKDIINKISNLGSNFNDYVNILPELKNAQANEGFDVGFGLIVSSAIKYGGYGNFKTSVLHHKNDVLCVTIDMYFTGQGHEFIRDEIIGNVHFPITCSENGIFYSKKFEPTINKYKEQDLFPLRLKPTNSNYTKEVLNFYQLLSDPTIPLMWGRNCGSAGQPPLGRLEMDALIKQKQHQLVEDILYSTNVVGRLYALQALEEWDTKKEYTLSPNTKAWIEKIKQLDIKFKVCDSGCSISTMSYKELLSSKLKK